MVEVIEKAAVKNTLVLVISPSETFGFQFFFIQKGSILRYVLPCAKRLFLLACLIFLFFF